MSKASNMKVRIFVFIFLLGSTAWAQRITNVFVDLGMNHSGIKHQAITLHYDRNDFRDNFNPNISSCIGIELKLKNKLNGITCIGYRTTGTKFKAPETTALQPDGTGRWIDITYQFHHISLPILFGYNFGEKFKLKPILGIVNNYNVSMKEKSELYSSKIIEKYYNKYTLNGLVGFMFYNEQLFNSKFGLGIKISYEKNLMDIDNMDNSRSNQSIVSGSLMLIYKLPSKN